MHSNNESKLNFLLFLQRKKSFFNLNSIKLNYLNKVEISKEIFFLYFFKKVIQVLLNFNKLKFVNTVIYVKILSFFFKENLFLKDKKNILIPSNFCSYKMRYNLDAFEVKYNFSNLLIINLKLYITLAKYFFLFNSKHKNMPIHENVMYNFTNQFQEIIDIKPDKLKKIFFKKKQIKTFFYLNEFKNKKNYKIDEELDLNLLKKQLFYKNIYFNTNFTDNSSKTAYNVLKLNLNKAICFWKVDKTKINFNFSNIVDYKIANYNLRCVYNLNQNIATNFEIFSSTLDFNVSSDFSDSNRTKSYNEIIFKKMFLYNFKTLFKKDSEILYNSNYNHISHFGEFKDFFFKKSNAIARDAVVYNYTNLNKFNNFFPLYCLSFKKFKKLILFSKKQQSPVYSSYYMYYLINFLELMCKKKIWIKLNTKKQISEEVYSKFTALFIKNKSDQISIGKYFFLIEFYEIIYLSFINRDINFFAMWFKKIMEKIHLKKHRKAVKVVHSTIRNNPLFLELTGVKGFSMDVRGKLGTAGNSKKKHYAFTVGSVSPTTKAHGLNLCQTTIRTSTGVLGVTILMSY